MNLGGTFLVVQWLRLRTSNARDMSLIPGRGNKIPHACGAAKKKKKSLEKERKAAIQNLITMKYQTAGHMLNASLEAQQRRRI